MKKLFLLVVVLLSVFLVACSSSSSETTTEVTTEEDITDTDELEDVDALVDEITIVHSKGETTVKTNPQKVAIFDFSVLDTLDTLGVDVEVGLPVANIPSYLSQYEEIATDLGGIKEPDIEAIFNFEPDIIFISGRQSDYYDELSEIAPTVYVDLDSATYMEDFTYNVTYLAQIFNKEEEAESMLSDIENRIEEIKAIANESDEKALIVLTNDGAVSAYGSGSRFGIIHDVLEVKQADENIEVSTHGQEVSFEYISEVNPDILFVIDRNDIVSSDVEYTNPLENELVLGTNAGQNGKIIMLDSEIWYLAGGGLSSVAEMIEEVAAAL